jgi:pimeloyl-ACP methyl ester carboxylesterase
MAPLEIADGKITVRGLELEVAHRGAGPLLLLLHGAGGIDPRAEFLDLLARHFEVVAPSHPGFGNSPLPDLFDSVDDLAYVYLDLLEQFDLRDVTLAGFSLGGWIAAEVAVRCAHRLSRLILAGPVGIKAGDRETRDIPDIFALPPDEVTRLVYHDPRKAAVDYAAMSDEQLRIIARNRQSLALYTWEPYMHNPKLRYRLGRLKLPVLLIRGASDGLVSEQYLEAYRAAIPGARIEVIAHAGHAPQIEQPRALVERMLAFTRESGAGRAAGQGRP